MPVLADNGGRDGHRESHGEDVHSRHGRGSSPSRSQKQSLLMRQGFPDEDVLEEVTQADHYGKKKCHGYQADHYSETRIPIEDEEVRTDRVRSNNSGSLDYQVDTDLREGPPSNIILNMPNFEHGPGADRVPSALKVMQNTTVNTPRSTGYLSEIGETEDSGTRFQTEDGPKKIQKKSRKQIPYFHPLRKHQNTWWTCIIMMFCGIPFLLIRFHLRELRNFCKRKRRRRPQKHYLLSARMESKMHGNVISENTNSSPANMTSSTRISERIQHSSSSHGLKEGDTESLLVTEDMSFTVENHDSKSAPCSPELIASTPTKARESMTISPKTGNLISPGSELPQPTVGSTEKPKRTVFFRSPHMSVEEFTCSTPGLLESRMNLPVNCDSPTNANSGQPTCEPVDTDPNRQMSSSTVALSAMDVETSSTKGGFFSANYVLYDTAINAHRDFQMDWKCTCHIDIDATDPDEILRAEDTCIELKDVKDQQNGLSDEDMQQQNQDPSDPILISRASSFSMLNVPARTCECLPSMLFKIDFKRGKHTDTTNYVLRLAVLMLNTMSKGVMGTCKLRFARKVLDLLLGFSNVVTKFWSKSRKFVDIGEFRLDVYPLSYMSYRKMLSRRFLKFGRKSRPKPNARLSDQLNQEDGRDSTHDIPLLFHAKENFELSKRSSANHSFNSKNVSQVSAFDDFQEHEHHQDSRVGESDVRLQWFWPRNSECDCKKCRAPSDLRRILESDSRQKVIFYIHGGGYVMMDTDTHMPALVALASEAEMLLISVNYRRPPEVPVQTTIGDCLLTYLYIVTRLRVHPRRIVIAGDSAGGALCLQMMMQLVQRGEIFDKAVADLLNNRTPVTGSRITTGITETGSPEKPHKPRKHCAPDQGLSEKSTFRAVALDTLMQEKNENLLPRKACLISPWVDMGEASDSSFVINSLTDIFDPGFMCRTANEVAKTCPLGVRDPLVSVSSYKTLPDCLPPMLIAAGEREVIRDQIINFCYRVWDAGNDIRLEVWQDMCHVFQGFWGFHPSSKASLETMAMFCKS